MLFHTRTALLFYFLLTAARSSALYITIFFSETFVGTRYAIVTSDITSYETEVVDKVVISARLDKGRSEIIFRKMLLS